MRMIRALRSLHLPCRHSFPALAWRAAPTSSSLAFSVPKPKPDPPPRKGALVFGCVVGLGLLNSNSTQTGCAPPKKCPHFGEKPDYQWVQFVDGPLEHEVVVLETFCEYRAEYDHQIDRHVKNSCVYSHKQPIVERANELLETEHASIPWVREGGIEKTEAGAIKVPMKLVHQGLFKDTFEGIFSAKGGKSSLGSNLTHRLKAPDNPRLAQLYAIGTLSGAPACQRMTCLEIVKNVIHKANRSPDGAIADLNLFNRTPHNSPTKTLSAA